MKTIISRWSLKGFKCIHIVPDHKNPEEMNELKKCLIDWAHHTEVKIIVLLRKVSYK